jgi:uncharacterized membrane protein
VTDSRLRIGAVALALVGIAVSGYLLWVHEAGTSIVCATGGCETVQHSRYAEIMGVPVAFLGLAGYVVLVATAVLGTGRALFAHTVVAVTAAVFSLYLVYVQVELIGAICEWCLVSDAIVSVLAILALLRFRIAQPAFP